MDKIGWHSLAATISSMTAHQVKELLDAEVETYRRPVIARRLHQRYSSLRTARERAEILAKVAQ